jgi:hypothetical protein
MQGASQAEAPKIAQDRALGRNAAPDRRCEPSKIPPGTSRAGKDGVWVDPTCETSS